MHNRSRFRPRFLVSALLAAACGGAPESPPPPAPRIAASLAPLGWLAEQVGAGVVQVEVLIPPNRDPHGYEPSPRELSNLEGAVLFFRVGHPGLLFEYRVGNVLATRQRAPRVLSLAEVATHLETKVPAADPHLWLDPELLTAAARRLAVVLGELVPERRAELAARAEDLAERMTALDAQLRATLETGGCRSFLVDHPAWGAFAARYGLEQLAIEEGGKEPGPKTLARLLERARTAGVRRLFVEPGMPLQSSRAVARELGAEVEVLDPLAADVMTNLRSAAERIAGSCAHE